MRKPGELLMCGGCINAARNDTSVNEEYFCIKLQIYVHPSRDVSDCDFYERK